jgi:tRNA 2-selenouridine synthase
MSWLFELLQYEVFTLEKGYKSFRNWALKQFAIPYPLVVIGGETGSGKTKILQQLKELNEEIIDLEGLANHKGSVFGGFGEQPSQEQFENNLSFDLARAMTEGNDTITAQDDKKIFVEDESLRIGKIQIPQGFFLQMRKAPVFVLKIPQPVRIQACIEDYKSLGKEKLSLSIKRLERRLGGLVTQQALFLLENEGWQECCKILISYYDKKYQYGLSKREKNTLISLGEFSSEENVSSVFFAKRIQEQSILIKILQGL